MAFLPNSIFWEPATDDYGIEMYGVYVDGVLHDYATLNQYTFDDLDPGTYTITIRAIDFCGREGAVGTSLGITIV